MTSCYFASRCWGYSATDEHLLHRNRTINQLLIQHYFWWACGRQSFPLRTTKMTFWTTKIIHFYFILNKVNIRAIIFVCMLLIFVIYERYFSLPKTNQITRYRTDRIQSGWPTSASLYCPFLMRAKARKTVKPIFKNKCGSTITTSVFMIATRFFNNMLWKLLSLIVMSLNKQR